MSSVQMLSPGVYVTEVDYSQFVKSVSTSVFGVVGVFQKGPINQPTLVTSLAQAQALFGTYLDAQSYFAMLALKNFFENGGSIAYVVRVVHYASGVSTAVKGTITLVDRAGTPLSTLRVDAANEGTWANGMTVDVVASTVYATTGFNLVVKDALGNLLETWKDLLIGTSNAAAADYASKRINGFSAYITVTDLLSATTAPANLPALVSARALASGVDGLTSLAVSDFTGTSSNKLGLFAFDTVAINMVAIPGEGDDTIGAQLATALYSYAAGRTDCGCFAIVESIPNKTAQQISDFRMGTGAYANAAFDSSFGGLYGPWVNVTHPVTGLLVSTPPAGIVAGIFARTDATDGVGKAPAGLNRGVIANAISPSILFSKGDRDILYEVGINPISVVAGALVVYGNATLQLKASDLQSVNVRRLLSYIETSVNGAAQFVVFEPNLKKTWEQFKRFVNPFLQGLQDSGDLEAPVGFLTVCDETTNTPTTIQAKQMLANVFVKPTLAAEFLGVQFSIAPEGASFTEQ